MPGCVGLALSYIHDFLRKGQRMRGKANPAIWLLCVLLAAAAGPADGAGQIRTCVFDSSRSTVLQISGITGVQTRYTVKGWFQLTIDPDAGTASLDQVEASLLDDEGNIHVNSLNQVFNMTGLTGAVIDDATTEFVGKNVGRTPADVRLRLSLADGSARLTGQVTPPPNSADRTFYDLDAHATVSTKYGGGTGGPGEILFCFDADGEIVSTPSIADDGTIYFGTLNATLYAIDGNGNLKWQWKYDCEHYCPQAFESSPAIGDDGTIYVGDDVAIPNYFFAISPEGQKKWEYTTWIVYGSMDASPVLLSDGTIFVGAHGFSFGAGNFGQLVALTPGGTVLDGFPLSTGAISASPVAVGDLVIVGQSARRRGGCNAVFAVKKSANILWKTEFCGTTDASGWFSFSSLAIDRHNNIFVANNYSDYFPETGPPVLSSAVVQLDAQTGKQLCETGIPTQSIVVGSPIIETAGQDANVIVATENGHVISFSFYPDGAKLNYDLTLGENSVAVGIPVIGDNGKLYHAVNSTSDANQIDVFEINADGTISESFHILILNDQVSSSLSMDDSGVIYFGTRTGKLYAVQTGAGSLSKTAPWPTFRHDRKNTGNPAWPFVNEASQSLGPELADQ